MRINFVVEPNDLVRMGQKLGINIAFKEAESMLKKNEPTMFHCLEDASESLLRTLCHKIVSQRKEKGATVHAS